MFPIQPRNSCLVGKTIHAVLFWLGDRWRRAGYHVSFEVEIPLAICKGLKELLTSLEIPDWIEWMSFLFLNLATFHQSRSELFIPIVWVWANPMACPFRKAQCLESEGEFLRSRRGLIVGGLGWPTLETSKIVILMGKI